MAEPRRTTDDVRDDPLVRAGGRDVPRTPDGRYIVVRGRLWRASNPALSPDERQRHVDALMHARRDVALHQRDGNGSALRRARRKVQATKVALGERGPVWWTDGAPDYNRHMAENTPYATWHAATAHPK